MANDTLQPESAPATPENEAKERAALEYACGAVSAAMDALAALDALDLGQLTGGPGDMDMRQRDTIDRLLRLARRNLRVAVGSCDHAGYDPFLDMLSAHGLCIYDD